MRPWKTNPIAWLEDQLRLLRDAGVTPTYIEVGKNTLLAEDLQRPGVAVYECSKRRKAVPWFFSEIDASRAVVRYELDGKPAGTRILETQRMRQIWAMDEDVAPLRSVTEVKRESDDGLLNKRCRSLVEAVRDRLLLLFDANEADALFSFELGRKRNEVWIRVKLHSSRREQSAMLNLGGSPTGDDFAKAEKDMLTMFGAAGC